MYHRIALDSPYSLAGYYIIIYFQSAANRINVFILGRNFSIRVQSISQRFTALESVIQVLRFILCNPLDIVASWPRNAAQMVLSSSTHYMFLANFWSSNFNAQIYNMPGGSVQFHRKWRHQLLPVGCKSRSRHRYRHRLHRHKTITLENLGNCLSK